MAGEAGKRGYLAIIWLCGRANLPSSSNSRYGKIRAEGLGADAVVFFPLRDNLLRHCLAQVWLYLVARLL